MSGIDYEAMSSLSPKVRNYYEDIESQLFDIKNEFEQIRGCIDGADLNFLYRKYGEELEQLDNITLKTEGYYLTFEEVVKGYKSQEISIANDIKNNSPEKII